MALMPLQAFLASFLLFLIAFPLPYVHANVNPLWRSHAAGGRGGHPVAPKHHRPKFQPGPWKQAHATFYEGGSGTFGGACGYEDVVQEGYGLDTAALSSVLFNNGQTCGACYEIKCDSPKWCKGRSQSLLVTATNLCPPNYYQSSDNGGWCNPPREHFDLASPAYLKIAEYKAGIVPVKYRRVPCNKQGGIRFTITGNPYFNQILVWNVGGAGDVISVQVKGTKLKWTPLKRIWGQKWETDAMLAGESLTFRVQASDGRYTTSWRVAPKNWQFGQTFEGKNFK
ncbi:Expansin [Quillaja saponaria]|uniref:Expansin n=1 Tax=Quillaja saponaria TaxID=32244 RepID=A0AAD7VE59_QUISA|nr:Expansin [Quillaja saponaria]